MNRQEKAEIVAELNSTLKRAQLVVLADFGKVTVAEITDVRRQLQGAGIRYVVAKNTLTRLAITGTHLEPMKSLLSGMTGLIIVEDDPASAARFLRELTKAFKKSEKFVLKGGFFDGEALNAEAVDKVADLPSREDLLATLLSTMQEAPRQVLGVIQGPARDLLYLLSNFGTKLEEAGS